MPPVERWWCWGVLFAVGCFAAGYAAASGGATFVVVSPFAGFLLYASGSEMVAALRRERDEAIRAACRRAEKVRTMHRVS